LVRSPDRLASLNGSLTVQQGDLLNSTDLARGIAGHDAVLSAFGPRTPVSKAETDLLQRFARALTTAMGRTGVRRVVVESVAFLFRDAIVPPTYLFGRLFFPGIVADASAMEGIFAASGLDWTMVRPPRLTDGPYTGKYRVLEGHLPRFGFRVSRADVADFMVEAVEKHASIRRIVGVSS
jgi:putative NADH-flavin reductase